MTLNVEQVGALQHARQILDDAGLLTPPPGLNDELSLASQLREIFDAHLGSTPHPDVLKLHYVAPPATPFTPEEIAAGKTRLTRKAYVHTKVEHPVGAIIEYPQTGAIADEGVAHLCRVDQEYPGQPRANVQFSLGDVQGQSPDVVCHLLRDRQTEEALKCRQSKVSCKYFVLIKSPSPFWLKSFVSPGRGIKRCSFSIDNHATPSAANFAGSPSNEGWNSRREVFSKTLGLFCALMEHGCLFTDESAAERTSEEDGDDVEEETEAVTTDLENYEILQDARSRKAGVSHCKGKLILHRDKYHRALIRFV